MKLDSGSCIFDHGSDFLLKVDVAQIRFPVPILANLHLDSASFNYSGCIFIWVGIMKTQIGTFEKVKYVCGAVSVLLAWYITVLIAKMER